MQSGITSMGHGEINRGWFGGSNEHKFGPLSNGGGEQILSVENMKYGGKQQKFGWIGQWSAVEKEGEGGRKREGGRRNSWEEGAAV